MSLPQGRLRVTAAVFQEVARPLDAHDPKVCPNIAEARAHLQTLSPERRKELWQ